MTGSRHDPVPFGPHFLFALLGYGASSRVYRASSVDSDERLALKVLRPDHYNFPHLVQVFERERQIGGAIGNHPHLLLARSMEQIGGQSVLVLPYVDGWTLDVLVAFLRVHQIRLPETAVVDLFLQICAGLEAAHTMKIGGVPQRLVHRDLKPTNILVGRDGIVKVLDFGIANFRDRVGDQTRVGVLRGTPRYVAPEQARGEPTDRRTDLFALGSILYEVVLHEPAFELPPLEAGQDPRDPTRLQALLRSIATFNVEGPDRLRVESFDLHAPGLGDVLRQTWARDPDDRPDSARALAVELARAEEHSAWKNGPRLAEWLRSFLDVLPPEVPDGEFGEFGPPTPVEAADHRTSIFVPAIPPSAVGTVGTEEAAPRGVRFGPLRLLAFLGDGSQARVFLARTREGEHIALKVLHPDLTDEPSARAEIHNEARVGAVLRGDPSPHIVPVSPLMRVGAHLCLPMKYVDGWTLDQVLYVSQRDPATGEDVLTPRFPEGLPLPAVLAIGMGIARGLAHAHRLTLGGEALHLVHRDLKPSNVMIGRAGSVEILDFGIAKFNQSLREGARTQAGGVKGTPSYMSPEQVSNQPLDARSDLFAFGSILYELLVSAPAFFARDPLETMTRILTGETSEVRVRISRVAPEFSDLIATCHARRPEERFQRASEVLRMLEVIQKVSSGSFSFAEWVAEIAVHLPPPVPEGFWGPEGPPDAVTEDDFDTRIFKAVTSSGESPLGQRFGGDVVSPASVPSPPADPEHPTIVEAAPGFRRGAIQPIQPATRAFPPVQEDGSEEDSLDDEGSSVGRPVWIAVFSILLASLLVAIWLEVRTKSEAEPVPTGALAPTPDLSPMPVLGFTPESVPEPIPVEAPSSRQGGGTPPILAHGPRLPVSLPELPTPDPTPISADTATLSFVTEPRARVFLDGEDIGETPIISRQILAGEHTLRVECLTCPTPTSRNLSFTAAKDERIHRVLNLVP